MSFEARSREVPCGHVVEHWHDGVMVEASFVAPFSLWKFWRAFSEECAAKGRPKCWVKMFIESDKAARKARPR